MVSHAARLPKGRFGRKGRKRLASIFTFAVAGINRSSKGGMENRAQSTAVTPGPQKTRAFPHPPAASHTGKPTSAEQREKTTLACKQERRSCLLRRESDPTEDADWMDLLGVSTWFTMSQLPCSSSSIGRQVTVCEGHGEPLLLETLC